MTGSAQKRGRSVKTDRHFASALHIPAGEFARRHQGQKKRGRE
jgi:hypothetical protein